MRASETQIVLDEIARYDGRTWATGSKEAWHAILGRYPLEDALQAVHEHYASNEKRIMPVNIRTRCIQLREIRESAQRALEAPQAPVVTEVGRQAQREIARVLSRVTARTEAAYRDVPPDPSAPTRADSTVTEAVRREQMARLTAMMASA